MPRVQQKRGTAANLTAVDPTPLAGELLVVTDENTLVIGNGSDAYTSLAYVTATPRSHTHPASEVTGLATVATTGAYADLSGIPSEFTPASHTHAIADVTNLQSTLDGKAASSHTHVVADVTGLQTALDAKASTSHTHSISDVAGLQTALDGKAASSHAHAAGDVTSGTFAIARIPTGTTSSTVCIGNDARLSNARTPTSHTHGNITNAGAIGSTANLPLITTTSGVITVGSFGTAANTFCQGNDARLSNARTPTSHAHGNISNTGTLGSTSGVPLITGTSGIIQAGSFGTAAGTFCQGNDSRLSNTRTPTDNTVSTAKIVNDAVTYAKIQNVSATDRILGRSSAGAGDVQEITCTAFGRSLIDDADAAAARSTLGLSYASQSEVNGTHTTGSVTSGQTSLTVASATGINAGDVVVGEGIAPGTTVSSISGTTVTLSANAGATLSSDAVSFYRTDRSLTPGSAAGALCRAWVNFNGAGTVAIRAAYNVSSITDNGTGDYTVNFATALPDEYFAAIVSCNCPFNSTANSHVMPSVAVNPSSSSSRSQFFVPNNSTQRTDPSQVSVSIFR